MMQRSILTLLLLLLCSGGLLAGEDPARAKFWEARKILVAGDAASAAELFRTVQSGYSKSEVADDCLYWMGRCYLRLPDREAEAVSALNRLVRDYPESPFIDEAARELAKLGEREVVADLLKRLAKEGPAAEIAARALAEFGEERGIGWLRKKDLLPKEREEKLDRPSSPPEAVEKEVKELRAEVRRLKREVEAALATVARLLAEREKPEKDGGEDR